MCKFKDRQVNFVQMRSNVNLKPTQFNVCKFKEDDDICFDVKKLFELSEKHESLQTNHVSCNDVIMDNSDDITSVPLGLIKVKICDKVIECRVDSGADISVFGKDMIDLSLLEYSADTNVNLHSAFGESVKALLVNLPCSVVNSEGIHTLPVIITCVVTDKLTTCALLTRQDYAYITSSTSVESFISQVATVTGSNFLATDELLKLNCTGDNDSSDISAALEMHILNSNVCNVNNEKDNSEGAGKTTTDTETIDDDIQLGSVERAMKLHEEIVALQNSNDSLESCRKMAKAEKSEFYVRSLDKLLYRKTKLYGFEVHQLVLPKSKRAQVLELAHDYIWGGHFAFKKTLQRIQTSFYWPTMRHDVERFTQSCKQCQMRKRVTVQDRVPITGIMRPPSFGDTLSVDLIGPREPASSSGYKYVLCVIDSTTKWPEVVCLRSVTAKETCDALLKVFSRIGIPRVIVSDIGTNFVAALTKEFYAKLGVELRTSCPYHPEANGGVERFNQTLKKLLYTVMLSEKPRDWDKKIEYLLWAYISIPHSTTGISPYQMVYGRIPRGPLSVLKDNMSGLLTAHPTPTGSVKDYCNKLVSDLQIGLDLAQSQCEKAQKQYVTHYNLSCRDKSFEPGDHVVVLFPDSTNKLVSKFQGPAVVRTKLNDYAYQIEMPDGAVRRLHANKLRLFVPRIQSVGVVFDDEKDFGELSCYPTTKDVNESIDWSSVDLSHLTADQQEQMKRLIAKHSKVFNDKPGRCSIGKHNIELIPGSTPKAKYPYRLSDKLKTV